MERKMRTAKKFVFFTAGVMAVALLLAGQPQKASAQVQVTPNGVGDLLIFQYWTTTDRDTLAAIVNAFGGQPARFVHVRLREGIASADVFDFTICLSPGDVWTVALTSASATTSTLTVGNPGSCDSTVGPAGFTPPPNPGVPFVVNASFGYIEAFTMEAGGGDDTLWGVATPLNVKGGFSSSYNATAFVNFNATGENFTARGNGPVGRALAREGGVDKELLFARYVAGAGIGAVTQLVLTFPTGNVPGADQISAFFFDETENTNFSPRSIRLPWEVNVCTIAPVSGITNISCPVTAAIPTNNFNVLGSAGTFVSGWVRLINNTVGIESDLLDMAPVTRFAVSGLVFSTFSNGALAFDQSFPIQWAAVTSTAAGALTCFDGVNEHSFKCASSFAPWYPATGDPRGLSGNYVPGDNIIGALDRAGTITP